MVNTNMVNHVLEAQQYKVARTHFKNSLCLQATTEQQTEKNQKHFIGTNYIVRGKEKKG